MRKENTIKCDCVIILFNAEDIGLESGDGKSIGKVDSGKGRLSFGSAVAPNKKSSAKTSRNSCSLSSKEAVAVGRYIRHRILCSLSRYL
jgi:hypothetical protein